MKPKSPNQIERDTAVAYRPEQVAAILNVGRTKVFEMIRSGDLRARKVGRATILLENEIREDIEKLPFVVGNDAE